MILYGRFLTYSTLFTSGGSLTLALALFIAILDVWIKLVSANKTEDQDKLLKKFGIFKGNRKCK